MLVATIDFMKAFDSITRKPNFGDALESCGKEHGYINTLKKLYKKPESQCDEEKRHVPDQKKETKQGDPLSSLLFNTVLQMALKDDPP